MLKLMLFIVLLPLFAHGAWSPKAIDYANRHFGYFPGPPGLTRDERGALASIWGAGLRDFRFSQDLSEDEQTVTLPAFFKKDIRVFLHIQHGRAPLVVVIPGIFSNADGGSANEHMHVFMDLGYHVLTLPSSLSKDLINARPTYPDEYPSGEARAMTEITKWAITEIGPHSVTSVQLIGESLGALTAAVIYARDSQQARPIFTGGASMMWPPVVLHEAIGGIDSMIMSTDSIYNSKCHGLIKRLETKWRILRGKYLTQPTDDEVECAPSILAQYSFRKEIVKLAKTVNDVEHLGRTVSDKLTFAQFIRGYAPRYAAALKESDDYGSLRYWLGQTSRKALRKVQLLTSEDDFLNDRESWSAPGFLDSPQDELIMAHWGGHIGLTNTKAYEGLLRTQFALH